MAQFVLGGVAHLARAFEWHSKGSRFESDHLQIRQSIFGCFFLSVLLFKKIIFFQDELDNLTWVQLSVARQRLGPSDFLASQKPLQSGVGEGFVKHPVSQNPVRIFFENSNSALIGRPCPTCKNGHPCFSYN